VRKNKNRSTYVAGFAILLPEAWFVNIYKQATISRAQFTAFNLPSEMKVKLFNFLPLMGFYSYYKFTILEEFVKR
jgi:hypothetical protein